jgi:hypothetical protein
MVTRKQFILSAAALTGGAVATEAYVFEKDKSSYEVAAREIRRPISGSAQNASLLQRELVRYATLAASNHNTQPWKFQLSEKSISIFPDFTRSSPAVDPDDHHLFASLGCAAENLIQASLTNGLKGTLNFSQNVANELHVELEPTQPIISHLFEAIPQRQCTRAEFDGKPISPEELKLLVLAGTGEGVSVKILTEKKSLEDILEYVIAGNTAEMNNPACVAELKTWMRFNDREAARTGDGLFSRTTGNPSLPTWLGNMLFNTFYKTKTENEKYATQIRSSAGIAVFVSEKNDKFHWVEAGRCYERFALQATALGIRNAMVNQPVEVSEVRPQLASYLGIGSRRPDLVVRFGRGSAMPQSLRRPVEAVLV